MLLQFVWEWIEGGVRIEVHTGVVVQVTVLLVCIKYTSFN